MSSQMLDDYNLHKTHIGGNTDGNTDNGAVEKVDHGLKVAKSTNGVHLLENVVLRNQRG